MLHAGHVVLYYLYSVTCLVVLVTCQSQSSTLILGSTVSNATLVSPGGVFEVGFTSRVRKSLATPVYTLAIWYANISDKQVVWVAPNRTLALSSNKATLSLSTLGDLQVYDNSGAVPILRWSSGTANLDVVSASIEDTGNLVLRDTASKVVWQSFDAPTDTLLPGQTFSFPNSLTVWENDGDWRAGNYSLTWLNSTYLCASWTIPYPWEKQNGIIPVENSKWEYWTVVGFSQVYLTPDGGFRGTNATSPGSSASIGAAPVLGSTDRVLRLTLDKDGHLRMYSWSYIDRHWAVEWAAEQDDCSIPGICGPFSICADSTCACPPGFQWVDAKDRRFGCRRVNPPRYCAADVNGTFLPALSADWMFNDLKHILNVDLSHCMEQCLAACNCEAVILKPPDAITNVTTECWHKKFVLINGFKVDRSYRQSYLRVGRGSDHNLPALPEPAPSPSPLLGVDVLAQGNSKLNLTVILPVSIGGGLVLLALLAISLLIIWKKSEHKRLQDKWVVAKGSLVRFTFREILLVTRKFGRKIGEGGFGAVYQGQLNGVTVAVKRLNKELSSHVEKEFTTEVEILGVIHHVHLVSLLGYCSEGEHRLLVYEYVENGSLDRALFSETRKLPSAVPVLEWKARFAIAVATARGLTYLHDDCKQQIIHCDVKPENILLDSTYCAKVADFGMSLIKNHDQATQTQSKTFNVRGTLGYLAPEYWRPEGVKVTDKVDVFSFGMVMLEMISGRRKLRPTTSVLVENPECVYFPSWAFPKLETDAFMQVVDPALAGTDADPMEVKRALRVAFLCINDKPHVRPSMSEVVHMLQGNAPIVLPVPRPVFLHGAGFRINGHAE